jgi:Tfp pilus assembly protein PilO
VSGRDRILVVVMAVAVVLGGFYMGVLGPKRAETKDLAAQIETAQADLDMASLQSATTLEAQKSYSEDAAAVATLGKAVPDDEQVASLLYQLDAAAGRSKVELDSITPTVAPVVLGGAPGSSTLPAGVREVTLALSFSGRFADLQAFLRRAHANTSVRGDDVRVRGRLLSIQGIDLTPGEDGRVEAAVQASAYIATPVAAAPPAAEGETPPAATASVAPPTQAAMIGAGG